MARRLRLALVVLGLLAGLPGALAQTADRILVLTSLPATYSVTAALAAGTRIEVRNVPEGGRPLAAHANFFERPPAAVRDLLAEADAVVSTGKLWAADPLYPAARAANIRVVDIDATKPWSATLEGVSIAQQPASDAPWTGGARRDGAEGPSIYFWLSPSNGARMADIVARDLIALSPEDRARIEANLADFRRSLLELKREHEARLAAAEDPAVYALTADLVYLTADLGLYVDGYFLKQDVSWTPKDAEAFTRHLRERGVRVVLHRWEPSEQIRAAIERAGARLVVLDVGETVPLEGGAQPVDGYQRLLRKNLEALLAALDGAE